MGWLPVIVEVARADGSQELVRVGTARRDGAFFVLDLLRVPIELPRTPPPVPSATVEDLESIAARARKTLAESVEEVDGTGRRASCSIASRASSHGCGGTALR